MHQQQNRIKSIIERRLLTPAYIGMLAGLLIRSIALVLSVAIPYAGWPMLLKVLIEGCAAVGMVGCADIVLSAASASTAALERQMDSVRNSPDYQPNPRLARERFQQTKAALDARRELVLAGLQRERSKEWLAVLFCGAVTVSYGVLFGFTVLATANWITVAVEIIGVATIPFVTWYLSAQYKEQEAAPEERAKALSLLAVDQRLQAAHGHLANGAETEEDISLLDVATEASHYHNRLVRALRRPDKSMQYLTTPELYAFLGVTDSSGQASIRRIVRKAGEARASGIIRDAQTDAWLTPKSAIVELFPQFIGAGANASARRTRASNRRTPDTQEHAPGAQGSEQSSNTQRTPGEHTPAAPGAPVPASAPGRAVPFAAQAMSLDR